jgi:membrane-associated protease RseP (regulator of RpoE activity)
MMPTAIFLAAIVICVAAHVLSMALAGSAVGGKIKQVDLFLGPRLATVRLKGAAVNIRLIPIAGSVQFADTFQNIHPLSRVFAECSGCLALLILSAICLGLSGALDKFFHGFSQIMQGALAPHAEGRGLLLSFAAFLRTGSLVSCLGVVASKLAALNMLPMPPLNGGAIVLNLISWARPLSLKTRELIMQTGFVLTMVILVLWTIALYYLLSHP